MRVLRAWRVGLVAGVLLATGWALAGDPAVDYPMCNRTPTASDLEGAKGAHRAATQFYERGDYDRAIQYWKDAYEFDCTAHGVLINIANAYEKKGDKVNAIGALDAYLARAPDAPDAVNIQEKVQNLKNSLKQPSGAPSTTTSSTAAPPPPPPSSSAAPTASTAAPKPPAGERPYGYTPWIPVGAGAAAVIAGAILVPIGVSTTSDADDNCGSERVCTNQEDVDQGNKGRTETTLGVLAIGLGTIGIAGGLIWQFVLNEPAPPAAPKEAPAPDAAEKAQIVVTPTAGPGYGGLSVTGKF